MADLVSIASSAVSAYQRALGTVSNNIANVSSEGYSRQEVNLTENAPRDYGTMYFGTGVNLTGVRRMYDEFVENSLRNATAELGTQGPIVNYANRVVNIMGSEDVGLLSAMDEFFDATRQLSTDSSSVILRGQFLAKAEGLAARFGELNSQLNLVEQETKGLIETDVSKLNQLSEQLALVNNQLRKTRYLDRQPPALLDERDLLLRKMSEVAKIQVKEALNGEVTVALGSTITRGQIVNIDGARKVGAVFNESAIEKVDLMIDPFGKNAEAVAGLSGGSLAGMMSFRRQILSPTFESLDLVAKALVTEVNAIHQEGIDLQGADGQALFKFQPQFGLQALNGETNTRLGPEVIDFQAFKANTLRLSYKEDAAQINDLSITGEFRTGDQITVTLNGNARSFTLLGAKLDASGRPLLGEPISSEDVRRQMINFLEGGNAFSVDGAFGRQIKVSRGAAEDLLITSDVFGAFSLDVSTTSPSGRIGNTVNQGLWTATDTVTGQSVSGIDAVEINGMRINFSGTPTNNEMLLLKAQNRPAAGIRLAIDDPLKVAAANRFRVIENQFNPSGVDATLDETPVRHPQDEALWLPKVVSANGLETLDNNIVESEAIRLDQVSASPIAVIPEGFKDVALYLGDLNDQDLSLQVMTRDGRHLLGRPLADDLIAAEEANLGRPLRDDERAELVAQAGINFMTAARLSGVRFAEGAGYSTDYLNAPDNQAYRDMELFYGVKAMVQEIAQLNEDHVVGGIKRLAASVTSGLVNPFTVELSPTTGRQTIFGPDDFVLNNAPLGALVLEREGSGAQLVMEGRDSMGRTVRKVLDVPLEPPTNNDRLYEIDPRHIEAWLKAQSAWGQGERQVLTFGGGAQGGDITVRLAPDQEVTVYGITPYATATEVAQAVAEAIAEDPYIANVSGRSVQAMDDGTVVIQFATTDIEMPRVAIDVADTGIEARVTEETSTAGILGRGEVQTYQFSAARETGVFDISGTRVHVEAGDSSAEVARKVAAALSGEQRVLRFTGAPNVDNTITVEGVAVTLPAGASPDYVAEAVKLALENDATFLTNNPNLILTLEPDGQAIRFTFPPSDLAPDGIQVSAPAGLTAQVSDEQRFVDGAEGRRVILNDDGSVTLRYQANEGNPPTLSLTPVTTPWPERQTLTFVGTATAGSLSIAGRPVAVVAGDTAAEVAQKVQYALESEYQTLSFAGSASGGETLEVQIGNLVIPVTLPGTSNDALGPSDIATAVYDMLYPAADPATNMRSGAFFQTYPFTEITDDGQGTLRLIFDPTTSEVPDVVIRPISATLVSTTLSVAQRLEERYRGTTIMPGGEENSLVVRYPKTVGDVPDLTIPDAATAGITTTLWTSNYREPDPGVSFNATIQSFQGLEIDLLSVYDPFGEPVRNGINGDLSASQIQLTQTPLGQGEIQTIYFGPSTAAGEIEISGIKVKIPNGASADEVAMLVRNALEKEYGSSALSATQREFVVNPDGSLSVRAGVGAGNVRDLVMTNNGGTGIAFRSETVDYLSDGQKFESEIRLGFGQTGNSLDLAKLGFRTGAYLSGTIKEDLLVFTTGQSSGFGYSLGATYSEGSRDPIETLRNEPFDVVFASPTQYRIIDRETGSVVADRRYDPTLGIEYRGITLSLNGEPLAGDRFAVDGNQDGIGNNANSLRIIELQSSRILGGANGKTLEEAYSQTVSDVGSMAFQSSIAQKALEVVKDQAVQARDKVSGVSLDEEAADLIRFQQAYQASAKVMQTASVLFDAIIQIR